jgi:hypothetical protein
VVPRVRIVERPITLQRRRSSFISTPTQQDKPEACPYSGSVNAGTFLFVPFVYLRGQKTAAQESGATHVAPDSRPAIQPNTGASRPMP